MASSILLGNSISRASGKNSSGLLLVVFATVAFVELEIEILPLKMEGTEGVAVPIFLLDFDWPFCVVLALFPRFLFFEILTEIFAVDFEDMDEKEMDI